MSIINSFIDIQNIQVGIVVSRFNEFINKNLLYGAIDTFKRIGGISEKNINTIWVPGACELPLTIKILIKSKKYDVLVALASVIKGKTEHFKYVSNECISKLIYIGIKYTFPVLLGILTTKNTEQAIERAGVKFGNKGSEAALASLEMINLIKTIKVKN